MLKIRCSSIGKIMTNSRSKTETLSKTCKTYLQELAIEELYGKRKDFSSKYTDKGNKVEDDAIKLAEQVLDLGFMIKNEEHFENDYLTGTPDVSTDIILDVKSSWDATTFPFFAEDIPNKDYYYQLQGYMALTGKTKAYLCYCLINTPELMVEDEVRRAHWKEYLIDESDELREHVEAQHNFDNIPAEKRLKTFVVEYDEKIVQSIYERIDECRKYYETIIN